MRRTNRTNAIADETPGAARARRDRIPIPPTRPAVRSNPSSIRRRASTGLRSRALRRSCGNRRAADRAAGASRPTSR